MTSTLITANAGCGKTWTLANRCIGWLIQRRRQMGTSNPEGLVAVTFTRKAAGEILHRVLDHLSQSIIDTGALDNFAPGFDLDKPPTREELLGVLEELTSSLNRLQFGTLDGLYHQIATSCAPLIDMPSNWSIGDGPTMKSIRCQALDDLLDACAQETIDLLVHEAECDVLKSQVHERLLPTVWGKDGGTGLLAMWRRTNMESGDRAWKAFDELPDDAIAPGAHRLSEDSLVKACSDLTKAPIAQTQKGKDNSNWAKTRKLLVHYAETRHWKLFLEQKIVRNVLQGIPYSKGVSPPEFLQALRPLIHHGLAELCASLKARMRSWRLLLHGLDHASRQRQREAGAYSFQDVADLLAARDLLSEEDRTWLYYQLDAELRDLALDEFQDTSAAQFRVIQPVVEEILAGSGAHEADRSMLIVADPKQAIYGWRGGTSALLGKVRKMGADTLRQELLEKSYRSGPAVIDFVNDVFESIQTNDSILGVIHPDVSQDVLDHCNLPETDLSGSVVERAISNWHFDHHETAHPKEPGAILAWRVERGDRRSIDLKIIAHRVVEIVEDRLPFSGSIGIMMPTNDGVTAVVKHLREAGIQVSEEGRGSLTDSQAVMDLLSLLKLGEHPGDTHAAFVVSHSPFGPVVGLPELEMVEPSQLPELLAEVSHQIRGCALDQGLQPFLESLVEKVTSQSDAQDLKALGLCIDLAAAWTPSGQLRLDDFIEHVETSYAGEPSDALVRVMTLHAAKGLEFDEIILPVLDNPLVKSSNSGTCLSWSPAPLDPIAIVMPEASAELRFHTPILEIGAQQRWAEDLSDRLSLLYVALTRARHVINLIFHVDDRFPSDSLTSANIIRAALPDLDQAVREGEEDENGRIWVRTAAGWDETLDRTAESDQETSKPRAIHFEQNDLEELKVVTPSSHEEGDSQVLFKASSTRARNRGTELHELFRLIEWLEDGYPTDDQMESALQQAAILSGLPPTESQKQEVLSVFKTAISLEQVVNRLSREAYESFGFDAIEVLREWPILQRTESGLVRGRIDRLVIGYRDKQAVFAEVIDFKSGAVGEKGSRKMEGYQQQMDLYAEVIHGHFSIDPAAISGRLLFIESGCDLPCTPCQTAPSSS